MDLKTTGFGAMLRFWFSLYNLLLPDWLFKTSAPYVYLPRFYNRMILTGARLLLVSGRCNPQIRASLVLWLEKKLLAQARAIAWWKVRIAHAATIADLEFIDKRAVRNVPRHLLMSPNKKIQERMTWRKTSGTSGEPFEWGIDSVAILRDLGMHFVRPILYYGGVVGDERRATLIAVNMPHGYEVVAFGPLRADIKLVWNVGDAKAELLALTNALTILAAGHTRKTIYGYPSELLLFARMLKKHGLKTSAELVLTTGQILEEEVRREIAESFGAQVFSVYVTREAGPIAFECKDEPGNFHVCEERVRVEIADVPGQTNALAITPLDQGSMPLLRYITGDRGNLSAYKPGEACSCGLTLTKLTFVGRVTDYVVRRDGELIPARRLRSLFLEEPLIRVVRRWRATQTKSDGLLIEIETHTKTSLDQGLEGALRQRLAQVVGDDFSIDLAYPSFNEGPGKFKDFVPLKQ